MKIKNGLVAALATVAGLALAACGNSEKKADNATTIKIATVNRSGSEENVGTKFKNWLKRRYHFGIYRVHRLLTTKQGNC